MCRHTIKPGSLYWFVSRFLNLSHDTHPSFSPLILLLYSDLWQGIPTLHPTPDSGFNSLYQAHILQEQQLKSIPSLSLHGLFIYHPTSTPDIVSLLYSLSYFGCFLILPYFYLKHTMKINNTQQPFYFVPK